MMETKKLTGREVAKNIEKSIASELLKYKEQYGDSPLLATILVGSDIASQMYINMKSKACQRLGIDFQNMQLDENSNTEDVKKIINDLNKDSNVTGILLQHPLPSHIDERECFDAIDIVKDVDGVNSVNFGKAALNSNGKYTATALAIWNILEYYHIDVEGKNVVIIGRSAILGKPLAMLMLNKNATVTICHSRTINLKAYLKNADIILSCVGCKGLFKESDLKVGAIVCDAGFDQGSGDYEHEGLGIVEAYTPVPGGVGPVTIACLVKQTMDAAYILKRK